MNAKPRHVILLALIVLVAAALRTIYIGSYEAAFDELWFLELSTGRGSAHATLPMNVLIPDAPVTTSLAVAPPWYVIPVTLDAVTHPPLYPMLLRGWREVFGESVTVGRAFSAVLSVLCVIALFDVVRLLHGPAAGLWAALIFSLAPTQIDTAQQVRNYPLLVLLALCAAAAMLRIERRGPSIGRVTALAVFLLGTLFTHYFAAPAVAAMFIYAMWRLRGSARRSTAITIVAACAIFALAWGPFVPRQSDAFVAAVGPGALSESSAQPVLLTFKRLAVTPLRLLFEPRPQFSVAAMLSSSLLVIPWLLLRSRPQLLLWALWLTCVVGFAAGLDFARGTRHLHQIRHTILAGPAVCALLAAMTAGLRPLLAHGLPAIAALGCLGAVGLTYTRDNMRYSEIGQHIADPRYAAEPVVFYSDPVVRWAGQWMYLGAAHYSQTFPRPVLRLDRPADAEMLRQLRRWPTVWLAWAGPIPAQQIVPGTQVIWMRSEPNIGSVAHLKWIDEPDSAP